MSRFAARYPANLRRSALLHNDSKRHGAGRKLDLALLVDGRAGPSVKQGITNDVAYRCFSTENEGVSPTRGAAGNILVIWRPGVHLRSGDPADRRA